MGRFALSRKTALLVVLLSGVFVCCAWRPLYHTDLWGHLVYGRLIWQSGRIPATEPLLPLAANVRFVDTAWLSQVVGFLIEDRLGLAGLQVLFGGLIALIGAAWLLAAGRHVRDSGWAAAGLLIYLWLDWYHLSIIRPQLAGTLCYVLLLWRLTARKRSAAELPGIPLLFALWTNLHGSAVMGLGLIAVFCAGRSFDVLMRARTLRAVLRDRKARRFALWLLLAGLGSLCNPYGPGLFAEIFQVARNPNLVYLAEWRPLVLDSQLGIAATIVGLLLIVVLPLSCRRIRSWELLLLIGLGLGGLSSERLLTWWAPVAAYLLTVHGRAIWRRFRPMNRAPRTEARGLVWSGLACSATVAALGLSPLGWQAAGQPLDPHRVLSSFTPVDAAEFLRRHPPTGLVLNTYEWGDYLLWAGPEGIQVMVNSHAHLIPAEIWLDYLRMLKQKAGWCRLLDRYELGTVIVDPYGHAPLIESLRRDAAWRVVYEDGVAVVLERQ